MRSGEERTNGARRGFDGYSSKCQTPVSGDARVSAFPFLMTEEEGNGGERGEGKERKRKREEREMRDEQGAFGGKALPKSCGV